MKLVTLFILLPFLNCWSQLGSKRQFELDSIVSTIPVPVKKDAAKVHSYLDSLGENDEEKVWMFYGFIGTHCRYDHVRFKKLKASDYSPYTTVSKSSGVCRDFAELFDFFCDRSNIPCYKVTGKTPVSIWYRMKMFFHFYNCKITHSWNVVKINGSWQLMDPTWAHVQLKRKVPVYDKRGKLKETLIVKSVNRTYYNPDPVFMAQTHAPANPAFYLFYKIPEYKAALKKRRKDKKIYADSLNYQTYLDAQINNRFAAFNRTFDSLSGRYSGIVFGVSEYNRVLNEPLLKRTPQNPFSLEGYQQDSIYCAELFNYMKTACDHYDKTGYEIFLNEHQELREKYLKSLTKKK